MLMTDAAPTDISTLFSSITSNFSGTLVPAILVALGAVVATGLIIFGAKYGAGLIKSFFRTFAK